MPEDVYFERIAGVGVPGDKPVKAPRPKLELSMDDDDLPTEAHELETAPPIPGTSPEHAGLDDNGFPVNPLKNQDQLWFVQAGELYRPIERCAITARGSGLMLIASGVFTLLGSAIATLFAGSVTSQLIPLVVGAMLVTLGMIERGAARDVMRARPKACSKLILNQVVLFGVIALWCGSEMQGFHSSDAAQGQVLSGEERALMQEALPALAGQIELWEAQVPSMVYGFFGFLVIMSLVFQGTLAFYYAGTKRRMKAFQTQVPPWVSEIVTTILAR